MFTIIETAMDLVEAVKGFFTEIALENPTGTTTELAIYLSNLLRAAIRLRDMFGPLRDMQRLPPVGWPPAVRVQLNILHNRVEELWTGLELNKAPSEALDFYRSGGAKGDGSIAIRFRPAWTGHEVGYASIVKAALKLYDEFKYIDWKIAAATESAPPAYRPPNASLAVLPNLMKATLTSCRELALARRTAAATEAPAAGPLVILGEPGDQPIVNGEKKTRLTLPRFHVIKSLKEAGKNGLSKDELAEKSGHGDAHRILKRLARSDPGWRSVIQLAGEPGGRYRLLSG